MYVGEDVDPPDPVPGGGVGIEAGTRADPGVGHEEVDGAVRVLDLGHQAGEGVGVGHVDVDAVRVRAELGGRGGHRRFLEVGHHHRAGPFSEERPGQGEADPSGASRDHDDPIP